MPGREVERKFLVDSAPQSPSEARPIRILQGYLAVDANGAEVRIRRKGDEHFLAVKGPGDLSRVEEEVAIDRSTFDALWPLTAGRRIEKLRSETVVLGRTVEVDVFGGALRGLVLAEVEFASPQDAAEFEPPDWFGAEVTADPRYKNRNLSRLSSVRAMSERAEVDS